VRIVLDTNVVVSGLLSGARPPGQILDRVVTGEFHPCVDDRLLAEYDDVLHRPRLKLDPRRVETFLAFVRESAVHVTCPTSDITLPDPDDVALLEVAISAAAQCLITGNLKHFPEDQRAGVLVMSPAEFIARYDDSK
jgi:putative PIN family toxin of toxin-antitoxin system